MNEIEPKANKYAYGIAWRWGFGKWGWATTAGISVAVIRCLDGLRVNNPEWAQLDVPAVKAEMTRIYRNCQAEALYVNQRTEGKFAQRVKSICQYYKFEHQLDTFLDEHPV